MSIRLLQVTDTHLYAKTQDVLVGMNCEEGLQDVLALIREHEAKPFAVLCTGDISQDNSASSYQRFELSMETLGVPQYWIPGNHDELVTMRDAVGEDNPCFTRSFTAGNWRVVLLNSHVRDQVYGKLQAAELNDLESALAEMQEEHALVCLHHNPVPVAAEWLQQHALKNPEEFFAVLDRHPRVKGVLFGHIHHELQATRNGVCYLGSPSTCIQFHPYSREFALDDINPGYRWLELHEDGTITSGVRRVAGKRYEVDFSGIGY